MTDVVDWLRARLDEDEQAANIVADAGLANLIPSAIIDRTGATVYFTDEAYRLIEQALSPDRLRRDVDAKRKTLERHAPISCPDGPDITVCTACGPSGEESSAYVTGIQWWPCDTTKILAMPHADRDDFPEELRLP